MGVSKQLVVGGYYWVIPEPSPGATCACEDGKQPARYLGVDRNGRQAWACIGIDGVSFWPMRWVGHRIGEPFNRTPCSSVGADYQTPVTS